MKMDRGKVQELLVTTPSMLWMLLFFLIPTVIIFAFAFKTSDIYGGFGTGWTLEHIKSLFTFGNYLLLKTTVLLSLATTIICFLIGLPVGYFIARCSDSVRKILLLMTVLPFWSSFIVRVFAWKSLLHPEGFVKQVLVLLHVVHKDAVLLYHPSSVILVMVYSYLPFAILPIYTASSKFNYQLFEAAQDLGMNPIQTFLKVYLPGIKQGLWTAILMVFIPSLGGYVIPEVIGGPNNEMIGNKIVQKTFTERNLPEASSLSALLALIVFIPTLMIALSQTRNEEEKR